LCVPPSDGVLFSMAAQDQHGTGGGSKTRSGRIGDLGGPTRGRDRPHGFFLMRRAGLVACANRKNRAAALQTVADTGERNDQTTTQARASEGRALAVRFAHCQSNRTRDTGLARTTADAGESAGARQSKEWFGATRRCSGAEREAKTRSEGLIQRRRRTQRHTERGVGAIAPICWMGCRLECIARIAAACVAYPPAGREESQQPWNLNQRVPRHECGHAGGRACGRRGGWFVARRGERPRDGSI
jgi:hypothetical protein